MTKTQSAVIGGIVGVLVSTGIWVVSDSTISPRQCDKLEQSLEQHIEVDLTYSSQFGCQLAGQR